MGGLKPWLLGAVLVGPGCGTPAAQLAFDAGADTSIDAAADTMVDVGNADVAACSDGPCPECTPGEVKCNPSGDGGADAITRCDATGHWGPVQACAQPAPNCQNGACSCTGMLCLGACVDTQTDATNCGRCGHDCCGGQCSAGVCQPVSLQGVVQPYSLALQAPNLFWASEGSGGEVFRLPIGIGQASSLLATGVTTSGSQRALAVSADRVFWLGGAGIVSCLQTGCGGSPMSIAPGVPAGYDVSVAADANNVYFAESAETVGGIGGVFQCPLTGCGGSPTSLATGLPAAGYSVVVVDDANVYWGQALGGPSSTLEACAIGGCSDSPSTLTTFPYLSGPIALGGASIFACVYDYALGGGGVVGIIECAKTGCGNAPNIFYQYPDTSGDFPQDIAADETNVYWGGGNINSPLLTCPVSGCVGAPTVLVPNWNGSSLALDSSCVYWIAYDPNDDNGAIMRVAKP